MADCGLRIADKGQSQDELRITINEPRSTNNDQRTTQRSTLVTVVSTVIPSRFIFALSVVGFSPSSFAASRWFPLLLMRASRISDASKASISLSSLIGSPFFLGRGPTTLFSES